MKSSLNLKKESIKKTGKKVLIFSLIFVTLFSFLLTANTAKAQMIVSDIPLEGLTAARNAAAAAANVKQTLLEKIGKLLLKAGATSFQQVVRGALNKIAYDTANYLGSGGKGQKPLFITKNWGDYLLQVGDEAAGSFIENFAANLSNSYSGACQGAYQKCADPCNTAFTSCKNAAPHSGTPGTLDMTEDDMIINANGELEACKAANNKCIDTCKKSAADCAGTAQDALIASSTVRNADGTAKVSSDYAKNPSFNVCQPSSLEAKLKISLGLVEQTRPGAPNCTASKMIQNWGDEVQKLTDFSDPNFLSSIKGYFDPTSNDLGVYLSARSDLTGSLVTVDKNTSLNLTANKGWQDKVNIAKNLIGVPGDAQSKAAAAQTTLMGKIGQTTGDIVVDAASVFLNQIAITAFNNLMSNLGKTVTEKSPNLASSQDDPGIDSGEGPLKEVTSSIIKPDFGVRADYDILTSLAVCTDAKNPGPTDCVIDNNFMQAVSDKKTVAEAVKDGSINGSWQLTKETLQNSYSLRNISILRKYRILPVGWEQAINSAYANSGSPKKVTVQDMISCFDPNDSYTTFSVGFDTSQQAWCRGLIDPNWVLKAPLNYCKKEGVGAQIINKMIIPSIASVSGSPYSPSVLNVTRAENYCADGQTCIKEKADGSCEAYGYCNEEKRTWNFSANSCDPMYNTCRSFTNAVSGKSVSYLENTLNYNGCTADSAGCRQYSVFGAYASSTGTVTWDGNKSTYFNKNITACNSKDEGCTELMRVKPTNGVNLVMNSDFTNDIIGAISTNGTTLNDWTYFASANSLHSQAEIVDSSVTPGLSSGKALALSASGSSASQETVSVGINSNQSRSLLPNNFELISGYAYTVSADVYLEQGTATIYLGDSADGFVGTTTTAGSWQHISATRDASSSFNEASFGISAVNASGVRVYIKNLKFEVSNFENDYSIYGAYKFYQKIIPPYLEKICYNGTNGTDYTLRSDAPAICNNFARKCNKSEVGCELFTDKNNLAVTAQVATTDYCRPECSGYDVYISKSDYFNSSESAKIIPTTAQTCSAEAVGCSEFTNLDTLAQGGESKEYYTSLKQCIKPNPSLCASFYSWEGTTAGYQLRLYSLQKDPNKTAIEPKVTADDSALCNVTIYNKTLDDPLYNPDCREFYNATGQVSYHLISKTVTCSDNCHAYRESDNTVCLNGGAWDAQQKACIYQAIPGEGQTCSAAQKGCREYNGNDGNNVKILSSYNFEAGAQGWNSNCDNGLQLQAISNNKNGHSLFYRSAANNCSAVGQTAKPVSKSPIIQQVFASDNVAAQLNVGSTVAQGKSYSLRFIAKAAADANLKIYFSDNNSVSPKKAEFATGTLVVKGSGEWNIYQTNLDNLDHAVTANEILVITGDKDFNFDDVVLTEITDRYYLIKNTSVINDVCYQDILGNYQGVDYNLGCSGYAGRNVADGTHYLRKFSKLCSASSVGCEQMIATQNYAPYSAGIWNDTNKNWVCDSNEPDCIKVDADKAIYAVYDESKKCNSADMSCSRVGQGTAGGTDWSDVYKKNNPNLYDTILCSQTEVGCEEWTASSGDSTYSSYFRDPGNETCQYRASTNPLVSGKAWYKIPVKRCDINGDSIINGTEGSGKICSSDTECSAGKCIIDTNDYTCSTSYLKTFGLGGSGNQIPTPDKQAGLCEAAASGCTEYIDPVSKFAPNLIYNAAYEKNSENKIENWIGTSQTVILEQNKLYIFSVDKGNTGTTLTFTSPGVKELTSTNTLADNVTSFTVRAGDKRNIIFASLGNTSVVINGGQAGKILSLKESAINYQLQANIDKTSCSGKVDSDNGCILFNERSINGANGLTSLAAGWNAAASLEKAAPTTCNNYSAGACTANQLVKVTPDRSCSKWLDCVTYVQDPVTKERTCYAVGECTRLNDKGECINFENSSTSTVRFSATGANNNSTGYSLLNDYQLASMQEVGLNSDAHYDFEDNVPTLSCVRADGGGCAFNKNIVTDLLVREPDKSPTDYPAHGASFLKVPASYIISPQSKDNWVTVIPFKAYFLTFLVNTKNSGLEAQVTISTNNNGKIASSSESFVSNDGWSRKIISFNPGAADQVRIDLGTVTTVSDSAVYFDDLNIEPVLEVGKDMNGIPQYVARECRLYPDSSSLTCVNKNNNVLKDGIEGYCLEHDANNKDVCLTWYPIDNISSTQLTHATAGYQGQFPLNYCTEVNGNFDLVEKRKPFLIKSENPYKHCADASDVPNPGYRVDTSSGVFSACGKDYIGFVYSYSFDDANISNHAHCSIDYWCVPIGAGGVTVEMSRGNGSFSSTDGYVINNSNFPLSMLSAGSIDYTNQKMVFPTGENYANGALRLDDGNGELQIRLNVANSGGWYKFNGIDTTNNKETEFANPAVRVYDYNSPPADEEGLKLISGNDPEKTYRLTCNKFINVVDSNGDNKAWASRIGINSAYPTSTPPFFVDNTVGNLSYYNYPDSHNLAAYGRNRETVPFGAATWPDSLSLLNSEAINLRNQFSVKNSEDIFAGRPYGCSNYTRNKLGGDQGSGCGNIGYCSLNPDVYCLTGSTDKDYVSNKTCADGGYGTCVKLWNPYLGAPDSSNNLFGDEPLNDYTNILSTLFLKSFNAYQFSNGSYIPSNAQFSIGPVKCLNNSRPVANYADLQAAKDSFCYVPPMIGRDVYYTYNNIEQPLNNSAINVANKGIYGLEFTTQIDPEQQPLKEIKIDWGDGSIQIITGQDSHPTVNNPHIFYHYYKQTGSQKITISIKDNWDESASR